MKLHQEMYFKQSKEISKKLLSKLKNNIVSIILHGSSVTADFSDKLSDLDLIIVVRRKPKKLENIIFDITHNTKYIPVQTLIYSKNKFIESLMKGDPIQLSCILKGRCLYDDSFFEILKRKKYRPTAYTKKRLLLNAYSALSLAISDFSQQMFYDSINYAYHAARSGIWAILIDKELFPDNKRIIELLNQNEKKEILEKYQNVLHARNNPDAFDYKLNSRFDKKFFRKGFFANRVGLILKCAEEIVRTSWNISEKKCFISLNECLNLLRNIKMPDFFSIYLSVDQEKEIISYNISLSHDESHMFIKIDGETGKIEKLK